jgi:hypothetical protein
MDSFGSFLDKMAPVLRLVGEIGMTLHCVCRVIDEEVDTSQCVLLDII